MVFFYCTLYDRKNRTNSYDFLRITRVHALLLSVSLKPAYIYFTPVIDMLALSVVLIFSSSIRLNRRLFVCTCSVHVDFSTACCKVYRCFSVVPGTVRETVFSFKRPKFLIRIEL